MRFPALILAAAVICPAGCAQERCGVARDLIVQSLENLKTGAQDSDVEDGIQLLKQATQACPTLGDAWYYRSLFEDKLGRRTQSAFALRQAKLVGSEAMDDGLNPFLLATPTREVKAAVAEPEGCAAESERIQPSNSKPDVNRKWALVVGIASFRNPRINLRYTVSDASAFADVLQDPQYGHFRPDHVRVLKDGQATTKQIKASLNWLARMACNDDLVVIYFATHGTARNLDVAGANYIVSYDTDVQSDDGLYATAIPMVEISNVVRTRIHALKVAVFLDTCHSGGAVSETVTLPASIAPQMLERIREGTGRAIIAASDTEENSYELGKYGHGLFTFHLIHALQQQGGRVPIDGVYQYVRDHVNQDATSRGWQQHPVFSRSDQRSTLIIGIPPTAASTMRFISRPGFVSVVPSFSSRVRSGAF